MLSTRGVIACAVTFGNAALYMLGYRRSLALPIIRADGSPKSVWRFGD